jgi:hypothetical protein
MVVSIYLRAEQFPCQNNVAKNLKTQALRIGTYFGQSKEQKLNNSEIFEGVAFGQ